MSNDNYNAQFASKQVKMPVAVGEKLQRYCKITNLNMSEVIRVMILESIPKLHDAENLDQIIEKARQQNAFQFPEQYYKVMVRLPKVAIEEIDTYLKFFQLHRKRVHFLYYMIEEKLNKTLEDVLNE